MSAGFGGWVEPGFGPVLQAFRENFRRRGELGASVVVFVEGRKVVELHGGERACGTAWGATTPSVLFSATKGLVATAFLILGARGALDLDAPVEHLWPGFGAAGKAGITLRQVLNHRSGVVAIDEPLSFDTVRTWADGSDPTGVVGALERQAPAWRPGTGQGYHAVTFGFLVQEVFRRAVGESIGSWLRREVFEPLAAEVWLGLPESGVPPVAAPVPVGRGALVRAFLPRVLLRRSPDARVFRRFLDRGSLTRRAFRNPSSLGLRGVARFGDPEVLRLELPWASGVGTAEGLARVYRALVERELVSDLEAVAGRQSWGWDRVLCKPLGFSQGFLKEEPSLYSPNPRSFGHTGAGGTLAFADPDARIAFAYTLNRMDFRLRSPRALALARAVYASL